MSYCTQLLSPLQPFLLIVMNARMQGPSAFTPDDLWIADTGASHHMSYSLSNLRNPTPYHTSDKMTVGSGEGLTIVNIGFATLSNLPGDLLLKSVYHVPHLATNLLSVYQLCLDNNCRFIFKAFHVYVQDKLTHRVLFQGKSNNGL